MSIIAHLFVPRIVTNEEGIRYMIWHNEFGARRRARICDNPDQSCDRKVTFARDKLCSGCQKGARGASRKRQNIIEGGVRHVVICGNTHLACTGKDNTCMNVQALDTLCTQCHHRGSDPWKNTDVTMVVNGRDHKRRKVRFNGRHVVSVCKEKMCQSSALIGGRCHRHRRIPDT